MSQYEFPEKLLKFALEADLELGQSLQSGCMDPVMVSPYIVELKRAHFEDAKKFIQTVFKIRNSKSYLDALGPFPQSQAPWNPGNYSVFMGFDFHLTPAGLKLIEINTNAAGISLAEYLRAYHNISWSSAINKNVCEAVVESFRTEWRLFLQNENRQNNLKDFRIAIIDEKPREQKTFFDFSVLATVLRRAGHPVEICDYTEVQTDAEGTSFKLPSGEAIDLVYNRYCDFYLSQTSSQVLRRAFENRQVCFSPNPYEYWLLADKERTAVIGDSSKWDSFGLGEAEKEILRRTLLEIRTLTAENADEIWSQRKKLFFKPTQSFGGRAAYRGEGLTRRVFQEALEKGYVVQEFAPAPEMQFEDHGEPYKYDIRFFVYQNEIQAVAARLFRGQVTNFRTLGGGFAAVRIVD